MDTTDRTFSTMTEGLLKIHYVFLGILGSLIWTFILVWNPPQPEVFIPFLAITLFLIVFNITSTKLMLLKESSSINKIFIISANILSISLLVYLTGGYKSELWVMYLLPLTAFCLVCDWNETVIIAVAAGISYTIFYLLKIESSVPQPFGLIWLMVRVGTLLLITIGFKKIVDQNIELKETHEKLLQSQKTSELGLIVNSLAHELNNSLTIIKGNTQMIFEDLKKTLDIDATLKDEIKEIENAVNVCTNFTRNILNYARQYQYNFEQIDITETIKSMIDLTKHEILKSDIKITEKYEKNLSTVKASPQHIKQVFFNIILNSIQSMPGGGILEIEVSNRTNKNGRQFLDVKFTDNGIGMEKDTIKKIFDPFFTTKKNGNGLGLWICSNIIREHKGTLKVESKGKNQGTTATITFPSS